MRLRRAPVRPAATILITGAASGIGRALALRYAAPGITLLLLDQRLPQRTAQEIGTDATVRMAQVDVRDPEAVRLAVDDLAAGSPIDRVLHCAGVLPPLRPLAEVDPVDVQRVVDVNLIGSFNVARAVLPHLRAGSHLALVASLGGLVAGYRYVAYSSSKFGVVGLAETLRMELAPMGIHTQVICPGEVTTPMVDAELASGDQVQRAVKLLSGSPISAVLAAERIQAGVESGKFMVIPTAQARALWRASRVLPLGLRHAITDLQIRRATLARRN